MSKTTLPRLLLVPVLAFGCVFTSRPQLPAADGSVTVYEDVPGIFADGATFDVAAPPPDADRGGDVVFVDTGIPTPVSDAASDAPTAGGDGGGTETDFCRAPMRASDASVDGSDDASADVADAGYFNAHGEPCDPTTYDAGHDASDATIDASDATNDATDAGAATDAGVAPDAPETSAGDVSSDGESRG